MRRHILLLNKLRIYIKQTQHNDKRSYFGRNKDNIKFYNIYEQDVMKGNNGRYENTT